MLTAERPQHFEVVVDVEVQCVDPVFAFVVGGLNGNRCKGIDVANLEDIDDSFDPSPPLRILCNYIGHLQSCDVEALRRRGQGDAVVETCFAHAGKRRVGVAGHDQLVVYFVTHYHDVVA